MKTLFTKQTVLSGLPLALLCCLLTFSTTGALAGAACDNTGADGQWPGSTITVDGAGAVTTISGVQYAGSEYSVVDGLVAGRSYEFTHANGAYITVREGAAGGTVIGAGFSPLTIVATSGADVYVHWTVDAGCATDGTGSFLTTVQDVTPPCDMSGENGQWPGSTITVGAEGVETTISGIQYAGSEYAVVDGFISGNYYELGHEAGSYITVREGAVAGPVVAAGFSPLQFTATSTATLYVHYTVDAACTVDATGSWDTYVTNLGLQPCDNTSASGQWPFGSITPDVGGAVTTIAANMYAASEFSVITGVLAFHEYAFEHAGAGYATVRVGAADGPVLGSGTLPLVVQATGTDDLYVHWTVDASCTTDATGSFLATVQDLGVPPCDNTSASGQWPGSSITPDALGAVTLINGIMYAGSEYSVITSIVAGYDYEFVHENGAYVTVREGAVDGPVIAAGYSPLTATAASASDLYVHWTADEFCNTDATGSWEATVQITSCLTDAGTFTPDATPVCMSGGSATISATPVGDQVIPTGYVSGAILADASGSVLDGGALSYTVNAAGDYYIHSIVLDPADQASYNALTIAGLHALTVDGGGALCGSVDQVGTLITVNAEPTATMSGGGVACDGGTVDVEIAFTGTGPWNVNYTDPVGVIDLTGVTDNPLVITTSNAGGYSINSTSDANCPGVVSGSATVTTEVTAESVWSFAQVASTLDVDFTDASLNTPTSWLWDLGDGNTSTMQNPTHTYAQAGTYTVCLTVTNDCGSDSSCAAVVVAPVPPANDLCGDAEIIACGGSATGSTVDATSGVDAVDCNAGRFGVWYVFTGTGDDLTVSLDNAGTDYDTYLGISETCGGVCVASDDDGGTGTTSEISGFTTVLGQDYYIYVSGFSTAVGNYELTVTCAPPAPVPANDLCANATPISCGDVVAGTNVGATEQSVPTTGGTVGAGVWYTFTGTGGGVTLSTCDDADFDTEINVVTTTDCISYTNVAGNDDGPGCTGFTSEVTFTTTVGETYYVYVSDYISAGGNEGTFNLTFACDPVTGISAALDNGMIVYPNPSNGEFVVEINGVEADVLMNVMDVTGRVVYTEGAVLNGNFRKSLNLDVASGTYLLQIATEEGLVTRKIQIH